MLGKEFNSEVYNYAISGTGTDQQFLIWENYAKKVDADLIVLGVLVENIERIKARFRETVNFYNQNKTLTPKPYFEIKNNELKLKITQFQDTLEIRKKLRPNMFNGQCQEDKNFYIRLSL